MMFCKNKKYQAKLTPSQLSIQEKLIEHTLDVDQNNNFIKKNGMHVVKQRRQNDVQGEKDVDQDSQLTGASNINQSELNDTRQLNSSEFGDTKGFRNRDYLGNEFE